MNDTEIDGLVNEVFEEMNLPEDFVPNLDQLRWFVAGFRLGRKVEGKLFIETLERQISSLL